MNKEAQVTWFVIVGIVLVFVAGIFFFYADTIISNLSDLGSKDIEPVNDYILGCLDQTATQAIELVGKQGGIIFESQGGLVKDFKEDYKGRFFITYTEEGTAATYKVAYGIRKREQDYGIYKAEPPEYPWEDFPAPDHDYKGLFGDSELPLLYKRDGLFSIQAEIESYVKSNLPNCLDFSVFRDYDIIAPQDFKTQVIIAKNDVVISLTYPVQVSLGAWTRNLDEFNVRKNIRLKQVYDFTKDLIKLDNTDISFDIEKASEGIYSDRKEDIYKHDDIIIVRDSRSFIGSRPFEFWFARQNRLPAFNPYDEDHKDPDEDSLTIPTAGAVSDGQYIDYEVTYTV